MSNNIDHPGDCHASPDDGCRACELEASVTQELPRSKEIHPQGDYPHGYYII
jgi:hypothetical protein